MVGLAEMLTCYVILSRIKTADSLLLLRIFSMRLFQQGEPPGPNCLLRFLRSRFNTLTGKLQVDENTVLSSDGIQAEYVQLDEESRKQRLKQSKMGLEWVCSTCKQALPAAGYTKDSLDTDAITKACVEPGAWRRCLACCEGKNPVTENAQFKIGKCNDCSKTLRLTDLTALSVADDTAPIYYCKTCAGKHKKFTCTVCNRDKERYEFREQNLRNLKRAIRRCNECRTCDTCGRFFEDAKQFVCNTRQCLNCVTHKCTLCEKFKKAGEFQAQQLWNVNRGQKS